MSKILLADNNLFFLEDLARTLIYKGHDIDKAAKLDRIKELLLLKKYDLLILPNFLEEQNLLDLVKELREKNFFEKILILARRNSVNARISSLNLADDFLAKPFSRLEFILRVENLLKRDKIHKEKKLNYRSLTLYDSGKLILADQERSLILRPKEQKILECLIRHLNHAVSYQALINYVWGLGEELPKLRTLNVYIRRIRMKLGKTGKKLKTIRAYGFILES